MKYFVTLISFTTLACGCNNDHLAFIEPGDDPHFNIVANSDRGTKRFKRKVVVFGVDVYASSKVNDTKLLHVANVLAQYLDNNEDGEVDDLNVLAKLHENKAYLVLWNTPLDLFRSFVPDRIGQDLGNDEIMPNYVIEGQTGQFDASLEEVLHLVHHAGLSKAYPDVFGQSHGSELAIAMDLARGGYFEEIPEEYPATAWYTYTDKTCDYASCQTIEYLYWALTSVIGVQQNRLHEIGHEWTLNTKNKVATTDTAIYRLLTDPRYSMPAVTPDGSYRH